MAMQRMTQLRILVVDDHEAVLGGTLNALKQDYATADIRTASTAQDAIAQLSETLPDVLVVDLALPEVAGDLPKTETGIRLLRTLMATYPELNIVVQSAHIRTLVRLKPTIDTHQGGFTVADKNLPMKEMLPKVDWALKGVIFTPREMRNGIEVRPEWLEVLQLAFQEGLQDKSIAERMNVAERTVRYYWTKVQNALNIYPEEGKNIRIQTEIRAREEGLL
jgi:DNA-binding NarL/FixJ family response regulator